MPASAIFESFKQIDVLETQKSGRVFRFGVFEVDAATGELRKQGMRIRLQEQPSQLLLMLLERAGEVVSREEICRKLWPPDTFVDFDQSLGTALRELRQALGDDAETPRYIETIPKHGFRFVAPVERISAIPEAAYTVGASEPAAPEPKREPHATGAFPPIWLAGVFAAACVLSFFFGWLVHSRPAALDGSGGHPGVPPPPSPVLPPPHFVFQARRLLRFPPPSRHAL